MTDPKRWTEESAEGTPFEQELVRAGQQVMLPEDQKRELWSVIAAQCPVPAAAQAVGGTVGAAEAGAGASAVAAGTLVKTFIVVAAIGTLVGTGYWTLRTVPADPPRDSSEGAAVVTAPEMAEAPATSAAASEQPKAAAVEVSNTQPAAESEDQRPSTTDGDPSSRASRLREENRMVLEARRRLRAGDAKGALRVLEQTRARFPHGTLGQEREALTIEALARSGSRDAAEQRARTFLSEHPRSPHAADVRAHGER